MLLIIKVSLALDKTDFHCVFEMAAGFFPLRVIREDALKL